MALAVGSDAVRLASGLTPEPLQRNQPDAGRRPLMVLEQRRYPCRPEILVRYSADTGQIQQRRYPCRPEILVRCSADTAQTLVRYSSDGTPADRRYWSDAVQTLVRYSADTDQI